MKEYTPHEDLALFRELMRRRMSRRDLLKAAGAGAGVMALAPLLSACGGGEEESSDGGSEPIRFVFSPDPVWNWLEAKGIITEMEQASGMHIERNESEDEFAFFAGGHADIVSTGSYETPVLENETGVKTVTFAKYNMAKDIMVVDPKTPYQTLGDLPKGAKVGVESFEGSSLVWIAIAATQHGRTLSQQPGDLQMVVTDFSVAPELVLKGQLDAGVTAYMNATKYLMEGKVRSLYDDMGASQIYGKYIVPGHEGCDSNNFVCTQKWYKEHPKEVAFFASVWERGIEEWWANMPEIVKEYPGDFGWQNDAEYDWVVNRLQNEWNEFVDTVYLDQKWIEGEEGVTQMLRDAEAIPADQVSPFYVGLDPETGEETISIPDGASA